MENANWELSSFCVWLSEEIVRDGAIPDIQIDVKKILKVIGHQEYYSVFCFFNLSR